MENKTALTQYLDWLAELKKCDPSLSSVISLMENKATELRDTVEKEQIIEACYAGTYQFDNAAAIVNPKTPKDYYNQTYKP